MRSTFKIALVAGIGMDPVREGGGFNGCWIGGLQLLVSPEFHF